MLSARKVVGESRRSRLEGHAHGVRREADRVVPAAEHVDVEELVVVEFCTELIMVRGVDRGVVVDASAVRMSSR